MEVVLSSAHQGDRMFHSSIRAKWTRIASGLFQFWVFLPLVAFAQPNDPPPPPPPVVDAAAIQLSVYQAYQAIAAAGEAEGKASLTPVEVQTAFNLVKRHPVADIAVVDRYDTNGEIGFCYGRAMASYLLVKQAGLADSSIRKLFIIGDMRSNPANPEWRFHVTLLVRRQVRPSNPAVTAWYAIDPIFSRPLPVEEWIRQVRNTWDNWQPTSGERRAAKLYLAPAGTIMPDIRLFAPTPAAETGQRVIELSFNPAGRAGFQPSSMFGDSVNQIDSAAAAQYFLVHQDPVQLPVQPTNTTFDFLSLHLTVETAPPTPVHYDYRGYFTDLLRHEFTRKFPNDPNPVLTPVVAPRPQSRSVLNARLSQPKNKLGSPRMFAGFAAQQRQAEQQQQSEKP